MLSLYPGLKTSVCAVLWSVYDIDGVMFVHTASVVCGWRHFIGLGSSQICQRSCMVFSRLFYLDFGDLCIFAEERKSRSLSGFTQKMGIDRVIFVHATSVVCKKISILLGFDVHLRGSTAQ